MAPLRRADLARVFWRSLWIQASWSFEGMQTLGFAYAVEPALSRLHETPEARREATARHLGFFNTNPILAAVIIGCVVRLEEDGGAGRADTADRLKRALMGAYGGIGDSLFWGALKPLLVLGALHAAYRGSLWAPWVFLISFGAVNLGARLVGFRHGYRQGARVVEAVAGLGLVGWARRIKTVCALVLGTLLAGASGPTLLARWEVPAAAWAPGALVIAFGTAWLIARGTRPEWVAYAGLAASIGVVACS